MTHLHHFKKILLEAKCPYDEAQTVDQMTEITVQNWSAEPYGEEGYTGMFTVWIFSFDGALIGVANFE